MDNDINESEIEREAEKIRQKEKRMEERRIAREKRKIEAQNENKEEQNNDKFNNNNFKNRKRFYTTSNYIKQSKNNNVLGNKNKDLGNENKKEEILRKKRLEEDSKTKTEIDYNKEDDSTVNNSKSNIINNSSNTLITQTEYEDKNKRKEFNYKPIPTRNVMGRNKNLIDEGAAPNEIIVNDMPKGNLDRSFDTGTTYMKRKISNGRNTLNINRHRKPDFRGRSQEKVINGFIENNANSFNPGLNINFTNSNYPANHSSKLTYTKKKSSINEPNMNLLNNRSFCEYPKESYNQNSMMDRNDFNMGMDFGGGLNSSFDAYMKMNINNINNTNDLFYGTSSNKFITRIYNKGTHNPTNNNNNINYNKKNTNNNYKKGIIPNNPNSINSFGYVKQNFNNNYVKNNNIFNNNKSFNHNFNNNIPRSRLCKKVHGSKEQFLSYNNNSQTQNYYNNSPLRTYANQLNSQTQIQTQTENSIGISNFNQNSPNIKRYDSSNSRISVGYTNTNNDNYMKNNTSSSYNPEYEKNTSINIEDLMVLEEKFNEIILALNKNHIMHNECFEFWNYYYNCSFYGKFEKLFKNENDSTNVQIGVHHILISVMICYDFSFEMDILKNEYSILTDILDLNHRNLMIICEHILSKISSESKANLWVLKLHQLVNNFNKNDNYEYTPMNGRQLNSVEKINYNVSVIIQNIRVLLKNYKTKRIEHLTSIFKKINEKTYEEINSFFRDNILRVDNVNGSVLASVFLKDNECFQTEPAPYIKTKNRKKYSLILDLDETLVHFKINNENDSEGVLQIRPGVIQFLEQVGKFYEIIVFTAATQDYGDLLIDAIEENHVYFEHRFYRQHTIIMGNDFVKDLNRIGRPLDSIIIVDNMPQNFRLQKENGINIKAFWGEDANDNALEELGKILINIALDGKDVRIGLEKYRDEIVKKVTSNISKSNY
jgi:Dullard-like phosphatase family protein